MIYKFRKGSRISGVSAQDVGETLEKIRTQHGALETTAVLAEAKKKSSKIHAAFEWDDKKAGHEFRLIQARKMIRAVQVEMEDGDEPAFVHISSDSLNYYQSTEVAVRNVDEWELVRNAAMRSLISASETLDRLDAVAQRTAHANRESVSSIRSKVRSAKEEMASV